MRQHQESYTVLGLMSGTSLDGLDLACCRFYHNERGWTFDLLAAETIPYSIEWQSILRTANEQSEAKLQNLHEDYGRLLGAFAKDFLRKYALEVDLIASHGHTVFHQPDQGITFQMGDGAYLADMSGIPTVCNFRQEDVFKGGQGAPLVPLGDRLLFSDYALCLNIGGIANISFEWEGKRRAFDICPANQVLNYLSEKLGLPYDEDGNAAASGRMIISLFDQLNSLEYYQLRFPKSLGREWVEDKIFPLIDHADYRIEDLLHTFSLHIAYQIAEVVKRHSNGKILITGGGAWNRFLVDNIRSMIKHSVEIPSAELVNFKEAIIFALLGLLRLRNEINCLASVTGASADSSAGDIYSPQADRLY